MKNTLLKMVISQELYGKRKDDDDEEEEDIDGDR